MVDIAKRLNEVRGNLPEGVQLVAISKYHPADYIMAAYNAGQRIFGESHEQELRTKVSILPEDIEWHFIGHLQTNKVKYIVPYISMVDAVDSLKLMKEIDKQAARVGRTIDILLELHIAEEATKYGFTPDALRQMLSDGEWRKMEHVRICGLMMMASNVDDEQQVAREMNLAAGLFDEVKAGWFADADYFRHRSWGMSQDYLVSLKCRSNMVRIGTYIFGPRVY